MKIPLFEASSFAGFLAKQKKHPTSTWRWSVVVLSALAGQAMAGPSLDRIKATEKITIAYLMGSPFAYVHEGKTVGYTIDLCGNIVEAIRKSLNLKSLQVTYLPVAASERLPTIIAGKADLECGSTTNNAERRKSVAFTVPHYITGTRYAVRSDSPVTSLREFANKRLLSVAGTTPLTSITNANRDGFLGIQVDSVNSDTEAIAAVASGRAEGFAFDDILLYSSISELPDPRSMKVIGSFLTIEPLAIMLSKNDPELKQIADSEMKRLIFNKDAYKLYQRWFEKPIPPNGRALNIPMNYLLKDFWKYPSDWVPN